jgi:hypothetical protein
MKALDGLFTLQSVLSLQGAAAASLLIPNVLGYLIGPAFQPYQKWAAFIVAMALALLVAGLAPEKKWTKWLVAVLNGFLIFASAAGLNQTAATLSAPARNQFFGAWF